MSNVWFKIVEWGLKKEKLLKEDSWVELEGN